MYTFAAVFTFLHTDTRSINIKWGYLLPPARVNNLLYEDGKVLPPLDLRPLSGTTALSEVFMVDLNLIVLTFFVYDQTKSNLTSSHQSKQQTKPK